MGSADPFDRMIRAIDDWAGSRGRKDVVAQIGKAVYKPRFIEAVPFLSPSDFRSYVRAARLLVAHAGMGSIITALEAGKPIIIMPKLAKFGEHRNDHQVATARRFSGKQGVTVAWDENDLIAELERESPGSPPAKLAPEVSPALLSAIREFISHKI